MREEENFFLPPYILPGEDFVQCLCVAREDPGVRTDMYKLLRDEANVALLCSILLQWVCVDHYCQPLLFNIYCMQVLTAQNSWCTFVAKKKNVLSQLHYECRKKHQIPCHTQIFCGLFLLSLSMNFSDPIVSHYPFYDTLQQILIHNQTSFPIPGFKICSSSFNECSILKFYIWWS